MNIYGEQYIFVESDDALGINIRYRSFQDWKGVIVDSMRWNYRLDGRSAWIGEEECEVANIKWQIIVEAK